MNIRVTSCTAMSALVLFVGTSATGISQAKEGFQDYDWGTEFSQMEKPLGLTPERSNERYATYRCKPTEINGVKVTPTIMFCDDKFGAVSWSFPDSVKEAMVRYFNAKYGEPSKDEGGYSGVSG